MTTTKAPAATDTVTVLYDRDCGFCRWSLAKILAWDRRGRLRPLPIQSEGGQRLLAGMPEEQQLRSWHLVHADGRVESAGDAFPALFARLPGGAPLAKLTKVLPGLSNRGYMLVADNRALLGKPITKRMRERATARIDARAPDAASWVPADRCSI